MSRGQIEDPLYQRGIDLIQQAIALDPGNSKWKDELDASQAEPQRRVNYKKLQQPATPPPGTVRIGSQVAEANLISKTDPVYPPLALQARLSGTVEFTATVGTDGKVQNLQLVRGQPLLVNAAKDAVLKYLYQPVLANGTAVPFITEVLVSFKLPQ